MTRRARRPNSAVGTVVQAADVRNVDTVIIGGAIRKRRGALVDILS